ncbi:hypothetical protein LTR29_002030 [Friedmanniomyces endolithicus]|nr:hypothetical protein LTR29_002030 [Friedmanniomyces endolithicus]
METQAPHTSAVGGGRAYINSRNLHELLTLLTINSSPTEKKQLPPAPGAGRRGPQTNAVSISEALGKLNINSSGAPSSSVLTSDSGNDEAGGAQLAHVKVKLPKKAARKAKAKAREGNNKAAEKAEKQAKAEAALQVKQEAQREAKVKRELKVKQEAQKKAKESTERKAERFDSIIEYFDETYESKPDRLAAWQLLCDHVGVESGSSIVKCKKAMKKACINILDFVRYQRGGPPFQRSPTVSALRRYTMKGRTFPLKLAKESPILSSMLLELRFK